MVDANIPPAGNQNWAQRLKRLISSRSPRAVVSAYRKTMEPLTRARNRATMRRHLEASVGGALTREFERLYAEARENWALKRPVTTVEEIQLPIPGHHGHVTVRRGTSDVIVYYDSLVDSQYYHVASKAPLKRVLDCGANVGLASVYFLSRHPDCRVVAVEPDPINVSMCQRNLQQFHDRVVIHNMGVGPEPATISLASETLGTWASRASHQQVDEGVSVPVNRVAWFLAQAGWAELDLLKVDIEGAELDLLRDPNLGDWLGSVSTIAIELESQEAIGVFLALCRDWKFDVSQCREITIARKR